MPASIEGRSSDHTCLLVEVESSLNLSSFPSNRKPGTHTRAVLASRARVRIPARGWRKTKAVVGIPARDWTEGKATVRIIGSISWDR